MIEEEHKVESHADILARINKFEAYIQSQKRKAYHINQFMPLLLEEDKNSEMEEGDRVESVPSESNMQDDMPTIKFRAHSGLGSK